MPKVAGAGNGVSGNAAASADGMTGGTDSGGGSGASTTGGTAAGGPATGGMGGATQPITLIRFMQAHLKDGVKTPA